MNIGKDTLSMKYDTLLVLDTVENRLSVQSLEMIAFADAFNGGDNSRTVLFLSGRDVEWLGAVLTQRYGLAVVVCEHEHLYYPNPELMRQMLLGTVAEFGPKLICFLHTMRNCQTASSLSVALGAACITAVESCNIAADESTTFQRKIANGKFIQSVRPTTHHTILTILSGSFCVPEELRDAAGRNVSLFRRSYPCTTAAYIPTEVRRETESGAKLEDADVVIAAGRGIGKRQHLSLLEDVARLFSNAAIGASRPLCDVKWLPHSRQIGVSGKTVTPKLYMACGISGSQQHLSGMKGADCIVAINSDPHAAIFSVADYIVIDDLHAFLPLLARKYHERISHE